MTPLRFTVWLHLVLLAVALVAARFDQRLITGANPWLKPAKFSASIALYVATLAVLLSWLPAAEARWVRALSWGVAATMVVEISIIFVQATRGTTSHYNTSSALNGALFASMGAAIAVNTLLNLAALALLTVRPLAVAPAVAWGARLGLAIFIGGALVGGLMIRQLGHTVGAPDGGPGLPGLGWSTRHGDLRAAHFLGMHALQALPLVGWLLTRWAVPAPVLLTLAAALGWAALTALLLLGALRGRPVYLS